MQLPSVNYSSVRGSKSVVVLCSKTNRKCNLLFSEIVFVLRKIFFINTEYFVANFKDGGDTITQQNHIGHGTDEKTTYITVETREGKLQQLKINLDDENFSTSTSILEYLVEKGEINPKSLSVSQELGKHRKSFNAISKQDAV